MTELSLSMEVEFDQAKQEQVLKKRAKKALLELMLAVEGHAKRLSPVDTGRLRASIHTEPLRPAKKISVKDGVDYGVYQEYGTYKMKPQPFMRPAKSIALKVDLPKILKKHKLK